MFLQHIRAIPAVNPDYWSFAIGGAVRRPLILSYADLRALPAQTLRCAIVCAASSADQPLIGEAAWRGVALSTLLDELEIAPDARFARIHAADRYTTVLPLDRLRQTRLVYEMDDAPLTPEHGFPARLIAPGLHGYKMPKWISRIELTDSAAGGFWEARGGSLGGDVSAKAAILRHDLTASGAVRLEGVAYGRSSVSVQVSIDGGAPMPVPITSGDAGTLARWQITWTPPGAGDYHARVVASAVTNDGVSTGEHSVILRIRA